jgi:hypothetical protein
VLAVALVAVLGAAGGILASRRSADRTPPATPPEAGFHLVPVPAVAKSSAVGELTLTFAGGAELPGFEQYAVKRGDVLVDGAVPRDRTSWRDGGLDPDTQYCYQVLAVVRAVSPPPPRRVPPACAKPDGR